MLGRPWPSTATEGASPTSSMESGTIGMNCRPPGTFTSGAVMLLHAEVSRTTNPATTVVSRLRIAGSPGAAAKERADGLDTAGRILASIGEDIGGHAVAPAPTGNTPRTSSRNRPVYESTFAATASGGPSATTRPP